jgi:hypothetical protein
LISAQHLQNRKDSDIRAPGQPETSVRTKIIIGKVSFNVET